MTKKSYKAVAACKWVDEVVEDAPYVTQLGFLFSKTISPARNSLHKKIMIELLKKYNIDYCVHGDDIITAADGTDCYQEVKDAGIFKTIPRTAGVSTTDLVGRMLLMTKSHHSDLDSLDAVIFYFFPFMAPLFNLNFANGKSHMSASSPYTKVSKFQASTKQIVQFSDGRDPEVPFPLLLFSYFLE